MKSRKWPTASRSSSTRAQAERRVCTSPVFLVSTALTIVIGSAPLRRAHVVITTYDTVRSEHAAFAPTAKNELKTAANKAKASTDSDSDSDSDADHFGRTVAAKKGKAPAKTKPKVCPLFEIKWWRIVLGKILS
jgi:hypothetical protein